MLPGDPGPLYLRRAAADELRQLLLGGQPCQVRSAPSAGRSTLRLHLERELREAGVACAGLDLRTLAGVSEPDTWCALLIDELHRRLELPGVSRARAPTLSQSGVLLPPGLQLRRYLRDEVLFRLRGKVVLLLDSVEVTPKALRAELWGTLRALCQERAADPVLQRLTLCVLAAGPPTEGEGEDLAQGSSAEAQALGPPRPLPDFTRAELAPLAALFPADDATAQATLDEIFAWTSGHPAQTLLLARAVAPVTGQHPGPLVAEAARRLFLAPRAGEALEATLQASVSAAGDQPLALFERYERLLGGALPADPGDPTQRALCLCGLAVQREGAPPRLVVRNRIYESALDQAFARAQAGDRLLLAAERRWQQGQKDDALLLRGPELHRARAWARDRADLSEGERDFLRRSEEGARDTQRRERLQRAALLSAPLLLLLALTAGLLWRRSASEGAQLRALALQLTRREQVVSARAALAESQRGGQEWRALLRGLHAARPLRLRGLGPGPSAVVSEPAPDEALAALRDLVAQLPARLEPDARLLAGVQRFSHISFSADGELAASSDDSGDLHLWRASSGEHLRAIAGAQAADLSLARDGQHLFSYGPAGARLWRLSDGAAVRSFTAPRPLVRAALSPDGRRVAGCDDVGALTLWDARSGAPLFTLPGDAPGGTPLRDLRFSPDGGLVALQDRRGYLRLWDVGRAAAIPLGAERGGLIGFSADGQHLLTSGRRGPLQLRDASGQVVGSLPTPERGGIADVALSPDGALALVVMGDNFEGPTLVLATATGELRHTLEGVGAAAFSRDGKHVLGWGPKGTAVLWDAASFAQLGAVPRDQNVPAHTSEALRSLAQSPSGHQRWLSAGQGELARLRSGWPPALALASSPAAALIASAESDGQVRVWDGASRRLARTLSGGLAQVQALRFSADQARLLAVSRARRFALWRVADGALLHSGALRRSNDDADGDEPQSQLIAPDLRRVAVITRPSEQRPAQLELYTINAGAAGAAVDRPQAPNILAPSAVTAAAFSPDGRRLVLAAAPVDDRAPGAVQALRLYDLDGGAPLVILRGPFNAQHSDALGFSPSGAELLVGGGGCAWIIDLQGGATRDPLCRAGERIFAVQHSGRRALVQSHGAYQSLAVWDARSGRTLLTLPRYSERSDALSPDGELLLQRSAGTPPVLFRLPAPGAPSGLTTIAEGCRLVERLSRAWLRDLPEGARTPQEVLLACRR